MIGALELPYSILNETDPASSEVVEALNVAGLAIARDTWTLPDEALTAPQVEIETERMETPVEEITTEETTEETEEAQPTAERQSVTETDEAPAAETDDDSTSA